MADIKGVSKKFNILWEAAERLLEQAETREVEHTEDMIDAVLECRGVLKYDSNIFLPLAMLHNIERVKVLKEYFNDVVITATLKDGKIVRLTPAENVIKNLTESVGISPANINEIISVLKIRKKARRAEKEGDSKKTRRLYDTDNKKLFHDFHLLSRFNRKEIKSMKSGFSDKELFDKMINIRFNLFFHDKLRIVAEDRFRAIEGIKKHPDRGEYKM